MSRRRTLIAAVWGLLTVILLVAFGLGPGCTNITETLLEDVGCPNESGTYDPGCCTNFGVGCGEPCQPPGAKIAECCAEFEYCKTAPMPWIDGGQYSDCLMWVSWGCDAGAEGSDGGMDSGDLDGGSG